MNKTVAGYPGGKHHLAPLLVSLMRRSKRYITGFGGMANEMLAMPPHKTEIYNDIDKNLCCLFSCLSDSEKREELIKKVSTFPYSREHFEMAKKYIENTIVCEGNEIEYASMVWYKYLASVNGGDANYRQDAKMEMGWNFFKRVNKKRYDLSRLEGITIWNRDILELLEMEAKNPEGEDTFYFLDSPYLENRAGYKHNMTSPEEHKAYCEALRKLKGAVMVCGYDEEKYKLYDDILEPYGFHRKPLKERPKSMEMTKRGGRKTRVTECIWVNYRI